MARERWMLGDASIELVAARENYVFCVKTSVASYALRLHRQGYRSVEEIHSELSWMFRLAVKQIPVPNPVSAVDGNSVQIIKGVIVDMLTWLDGTRLSEFQATEEIYFQLGSLLAQMHIATDSWEPPDTFSRPTWDLAGSQPTWGRFWSNPLLTSDQKDRFLEFRENACSALEKLQQPDCGLIHADLVPDNVLYNGQDIQVIDFDDGGFGYRLFDLATISHRSKRLSGADDLTNAVVAGYGKHRPLDVGSLPLFEALRACTYVGWNISRMSEPGGVERNERFITEAEVSVSNYYRSVA